MKTRIYFSFAIFLLFLSSCSNGQNRATELLSPEKFQETMKTNPNAPVLDVRTPGEFSGGFIGSAKNVDWNGADFDAGIANLDKSKPVFVYCLSGGRSGSAAKKMRKDGFKAVYELDGGIMKWRSAGLPESRPAGQDGKGTGMSKSEFEKQLRTDKTVLVDFFAEWCGPCKKMKPDLDKMVIDLKESVVILRIDADKNPELANELGVDGLPTLLVYKKSAQVMRAEGYQSKEQLLDLVK